MKKLFIYFSIAIFFISCKNDEITYPDYSNQTVYFSVQYPVRNIQLGEARFDNSLDLDSTFEMGVAVSGMYKNTKDREVYVRYAPELVTNADTVLLTELGDTIKVLPPSYYSPDLSTLQKIVIPAGKFDGRIRIKLNSAFYNDPKTIGVRYVIPLVILPSKVDTVFTGIRPKSYILTKNLATTIDSVLIGRPSDGIKYPNRLISSNWQVGFLPMDYTLYGVKYTNKYHGNYFHFGTDSTQLGAVMTKNRYNTNKPFATIENSVVTLLKTASLTECTIDRLGGTNIGAKYTVRLKFNTDNTVGITSVPTLANDHVVVTGSGKFLDSNVGLSWGGKGRKTIILKYRFTDVKGIHNCTDTIVYRTDAIVYQDFKIRQMVGKRSL